MFMLNIVIFPARKQHPFHNMSNYMYVLNLHKDHPSKTREITFYFFNLHKAVNETLGKKIVCYTLDRVNTSFAIGIVQTLNSILRFV
jgi:hypothetical protein